MFLLSTSIFSQKLFTEVSPSSLTLTSEDSTRIAKHANSDFTTSSKIVTVGDLPNLLQNGMLDFTIPDFTIPGLSTVFSAETAKLDYTDSGEYGWVAYLEEGLGHIILVAKQNSFVGLVQTNEGLFTIEYLKAGYSILVEHDSDEHENHDGTKRAGTASTCPSEACPQVFTFARWK